MQTLLKLTCVKDFGAFWEFCDKQAVPWLVTNQLSLRNGMPFLVLFETPLERKGCAGLIFWYL